MKYSVSKSTFAPPPVLAMLYEASVTIFLFRVVCSLPLVLCAGFPVNVMCLLPFMVQHYEEPTAICREAADNIAEVKIFPLPASLQVYFFLFVLLLFHL